MRERVHVQTRAAIATYDWSEGGEEMSEQEEERGETKRERETCSSGNEAKGLAAGGGAQRHNSS